MGVLQKDNPIRYRLSWPETVEGAYGEEWVDEEERHHRDDGPAIAHFYPNGKPLREVYYQHGQRHRADGAAVTRYDERGNPTLRTYWLWGQEVSPFELPVVDERTRAEVATVGF